MKLEHQNEYAKSNV